MLDLGSSIRESISSLTASQLTLARLGPMRVIDRNCAKTIGDFSERVPRDGGESLSRADL
jgi:hypothetical protein